MMKMKNRKLIIAVLMSTVTMVTATAQKSKMATSDDSLSYALGVANYM